MVGSPSTPSTSEWIARLPNRTASIAGIVLLAHGCRQSPRVWFSKSGACADCIAKPEERCMAARLLEANFAVVAAGNPTHGAHGCWESADVPVVAERLRAWRLSVALPSSTPLFLLGPSSGGFFATQYARQWRDVRAIAIQVSTPSLTEVQPPLPSGAVQFPPMQMILMQRDSGKLRDAQAVASRPNVELITATPKPVTPTFFSEGILGLSAELSHALQQALIRAGFVDRGSLMVTKHPSRGSWKDVVKAPLEESHRKRRAGALPQDSLQVAMDGVFARLDLAYAYHASTCEFIDRSIAFFHRAADQSTQGTAGRHSGHGRPKT